MRRRRIKDPAGLRTRISFKFANRRNKGRSYSTFSKQMLNGIVVM